MPNPSTAPVTQFNQEVTSFGDRLAAAREAKGLSSEGLALKIGVDHDMVIA